MLRAFGPSSPNISRSFDCFFLFPLSGGRSVRPRRVTQVASIYLIWCSSAQLTIILRIDHLRPPIQQYNRITCGIIVALLISQRAISRQPGRALLQSVASAQQIRQSPKTQGSANLCDVSGSLCLGSLRIIHRLGDLTVARKEKKTKGRNSKSSSGPRQERPPSPASKQLCNRFSLYFH